MTVPEPSANARRGRPRIISATALRQIQSLFPELKTVRGRQNAQYGLFGLAVFNRLWNQGERWCAWFADLDAMRAGSNGSSFKAGILEQLGRVVVERDTETAVEWAKELNPEATVKKNITMIRRWRVGARRPASAVDLSAHLVNAINDYLDRHPDTTTAMVSWALQNTEDIFSEAASE